MPSESPERPARTRRTTAQHKGEGRDRIARDRRRFGHARRTAGRVDAPRRADVVERAIKQLAQTPDTRVVVATDGSVPLPARAARRTSTFRPCPSGPKPRRRSPPGSGRRWSAADVVRVGRGDAGRRVTDEASRRAAEDAVYAALFRPDLGFVARRFNKPISVRLTRHLLVGTPITPNQITLVAAAIGVLGCALIATGRYGGHRGGLRCCEHIQSVLDGCDGELARVRLQQSKLGAWLDTFVDDVLNVMITVAIGVGLWRGPAAGTWALGGRASRAARCWSPPTSSSCATCAGRRPAAT